MNAEIGSMSMRVLGPVRPGLLLLLLMLQSCGGGAKSTADHPQTPGANATPPTIARSSASPEPSTAARTPPQPTAPLAGERPPCGTAGAPPARYEHVIWIWMENHNETAILDSQQAPYFNRLVHECATASPYAMVGSPSLPNYIGATAGSTFGIKDDANPKSHPLQTDNLYRQVRSTGRTAKSYEESMPTNCSLVGSGRYAVKHNPQAYFAAADDRSACERDNVPLGDISQGELANDLARDTLPAFSFITPDLCNDTHDCPVATGDTWLAQWIPVILASRAYVAGTTAVMVVYDEPTPMPNVFIAPSVVPGAVASDSFSHYALLRATEEMLGIAVFLGAADSSPGLRGAVHF